MTEAICSALEWEIEQAWLSLTRAYRVRTIYLTSGNKLLWGTRGVEASHHSIEVGTFTNSISLADFRYEVFGVFDQRRGGDHVR